MAQGKEGIQERYKNWEQPNIFWTKNQKTEKTGKNEVLGIKNQSGRDVAEMGLFMGCKEEEKIEKSSMIELKETVEILGLGSTINPLQKQNKVEDLDNPQLLPCAAVQFAREPWDFLVITTETLILYFMAKAQHSCKRHYHTVIPTIPTAKASATPNYSSMVASVAVRVTLLLHRYSALLSTTSLTKSSKAIRLEKLRKANLKDERISKLGWLTAGHLRILKGLVQGFPQEEKILIDKDLNGHGGDARQFTRIRGGRMKVFKKR
ncbi:hypothetical protein CR513_08534, partial [Mucuna pruriens]